MREPKATPVDFHPLFLWVAGRLKGPVTAFTMRDALTCEGLPDAEIPNKAMRDRVTRFRHLNSEHRLLRLEAWLNRPTRTTRSRS